MIKIENLRMTYRSAGTEHVAVKDVSLTVEDGEFYTLLGPSGCGKTTTLRCVAGLEKPDSGEITIGDQVVYSSSCGIWVPPYARNIGMVFQSYAIWPHMSVFENVAFPLKHLRPKPSRQEIRDRVNEALAMVHLDGLGDRPAPHLSGGQQQRLALARALVGKPRIILLDEPLSNLDAKLREEMRTEIRRLIDELQLTTLFVTHEQIEALTMSDIVAVMRDGDIVQSASPSDIYFNPSGPFIADFIGKTKLIEAKILVLQTDTNAQVETAIGPFTCRVPSDAGVGDTVFMVIRPEDIVIRQEREGASGNMLRGLVATTHFHGSLTDCVIQVGAQSMRVHTRPQYAPVKGEMVDLHLPVEHCFAIRAA